MANYDDVKTTNVNTPPTSSVDTNKKSGLMDKAGEFIEKAGQKISDAGAKNIGQKIHNLGDRVESTHEDPMHPKDV